MFVLVGCLTHEGDDDKEENHITNYIISIGTFFRNTMEFTRITDLKTKIN